MLDRTLRRVRAHVLRYPGSAVCAVGLLGYALAGVLRPDASVATLAQLEAAGISRAGSIAAFVIAAAVVVVSNTLWVKVVALTLTINVFAAVSIAYTFTMDRVAFHAPLAHVLVTFGMYALVFGEVAWIRDRVREVVSRWTA